MMPSLSLLSSLLFLFLIIPVTISLNFNVDYKNFDYIKLDHNGGSAYVGPDQAIWLAPQSTDSESMESGPRVGRATYNQSLHLWDKKSNKVADFSTYFRFEIYSENNNNDSYGDGIAFFMAPVCSVIPNGSAGGGLGLVSSSKISTNNSLDNCESFLAVEFDTYLNEWEKSLPIPHVGIDMNSVMSHEAVQWPNNVSVEVDNHAWISYNSTTMRLRVDFTGNPGPVRDEKNPIYGNLSYVVDLRKYLPEHVVVGFSASRGDGFERHKVYIWNFTSTELGDEGNGGGRNGNLRLVLGLTVGILSAFVVVSAVVISWYIKKNGKTASSSDDGEDLIDGPDMDDEFEKGSGPKKFSYKELVHSTKKFSETEKLGEGGFGQVYKGFLEESNSYIAVKKLSGRTNQGLREYASEVKIISKLRHKNLVQFIGWCHRRGNLLLVYEYMPNGSLDYHLFGRDLIPLSWEARHKIALGLASALLYLHEECEQCVLHRDIKSSNIMLDSNFNAKLGDFGLARFVDHEKGSQTTLVAGTMGYMAPESVITGRASKESDVYSFGVVLLEIACGKRPIEAVNKQVGTTLIEYVWNLYGTGKLLDAADPKLWSEFGAREMETLMVVGLWCVHPDSRCRPMIREAKHVLTCEATLPTIPRMLPQVMYYTPGSGHMFTGSSSYGGGQQVNYTDQCSTSLATTSTSFSMVSPR